MTLQPSQVRTALEGLPGWTEEGGALVRGVPVTDDSRQALIEAVANTSRESSAAAEVHVQSDVVVLRVGAAAGVTPDDVELAARLDRVLTGSANDEGDSTTTS